MSLFAAMLLTYLISLRITHSIASPVQALAAAMEDVRRTGDVSRRVEIHGEDELASMSRGFNAMLQDLGDRDEQLQASEMKFRSMFESSPVGVIECDMSEIKVMIDSLCSQGVDDLESYCHSQPGMDRECASRVRVLDVNPAMLSLLGADHREMLIGHLPGLF